MDDYNYAGVLGNFIFVFSSLRARMLVQGILQRNQLTQTVISNNNNIIIIIISIFIEWQQTFSNALFSAAVAAALTSCIANWTAEVLSEWSCSSKANTFLAAWTKSEIKTKSSVTLSYIIRNYEIQLSGSRPISIYQNSYLAPRLGGIKVRNVLFIAKPLLICFSSPKPRCQVISELVY